MTDPLPPSPPSSSPQPQAAPPMTKQTAQPHVEGHSRFRLVTLALVGLIVVALVYVDQRTPLDLRLINYRLSPDELGRQVTYVNISPLTDVATPSGDQHSTRLETTIYTKIGHKAVRAAGCLDLTLKDAGGNVMQSWKGIKLPPSGSDVEWAGFPLGGWRASLLLDRLPATPEAYLDATYTNPADMQFAARVPVQILAR